MTIQPGNPDTMLKQWFYGQRALLWYALLVIGLPVLTLVVFGLIKLWQNQWLIPVSMLWLVSTLTGYLLYRYWPSHWRFGKSKGKHNKNGLATTEQADNARDEWLEPLPVRLEERSDWTTIDRRVWMRCVQTIEEVLKESPNWQAMPDLGLTLLGNVSENYRIEKSGKAASTLLGTPDSNNTYSFTLPEVLLVLSVTSSRYRHLLLAHVPFADRIKVSALLSLHARQDQIIQGAGWLNTLRRTARFVNPVAALTAELRDQFTNRIFTNFSDKVQHDLKRLLLQEVAQVGMDLYSGRLKSSEEELADFRSDAFTQDIHSKVQPTEPVRVVLTGQVSSGKSSLVNALIKRLEAETDILSTTDRTTVHELRLPLDDQGQGDLQQLTEPSPEPLHLVDTVGLDDTADSVNDLSEIALQADLLIWVARATQPARAAEFQLHQKLQNHLQQDLNRRAPPMLLVLTYVDQLRPKNQWQPPYDLGSNDPKATSIKLAMQSCLSQIGLPENTAAVPVCLSEKHEHYNVDEVAAQIMLLHEDATHSQLNRRRTQRNSQTGSWRERWEQARNLGKVSGKLLARSVFGDKA